MPQYIASAAKYRGWYVLPNVLSFAQERLNFLTGINEKSKKYQEYKGIVDAVQGLFKSITESTAEELLHDEAVEQLAVNNEATNAIRDIVGALLFDPTITETKKTIN